MKLRWPWVYLSDVERLEADHARTVDDYERVLADHHRRQDAHRAELGRVELRGGQQLKEFAENLQADHRHELARLEELHEAELLRLQETYQVALEGWRSQGTLLAEQLGTALAYQRELERDLLQLKREGYYPPTPAGAAAPDVTLPPAVLDAIEEVGFSAEVVQHLETFAWQQLEAGILPAAVAERIRKGEGPEPERSRANRVRVQGGKVVGDIPQGSPFERAPNEDEEEDEDDDDD
jgi:hypothetical protein